VIRRVAQWDHGLAAKLFVILQDVWVSCGAAEHILEIFPNRAMDWLPKRGESIQRGFRKGAHIEIGRIQLGKAIAYSKRFQVQSKVADGDSRSMCVI
jgi:hypothetical protein